VSPSAYDFDGDGAAEVIVRGSEQWFLLDGATGGELSALPSPSGTGGESPVVADIDNDCVSEILIASCYGATTPPNQVVAYECDAGGPRARPLWNQSQYHVTNVAHDGTIPAIEPPAWQRQNSWRAQVPANANTPIADAGPDQTICSSAIATLDGAGSTPCDAAGLEYRWMEGATVLPGCGWSTIATCDVMPAVTTTYTLEVSCLGSPTACVMSDTVNVDVVAVPAPIAAAGADESVCEMHGSTLDASSSTDLGCPGGLVYEWRDGATVVRPADPDPTWSPPTALAGTTTYTVVVNCAGPPGCEGSDDVTVEVRSCSLAVTFDVYRAAVQRDGTVLVTWKTLEEDGTLGFVVERAPSSTGPFVAAGDHEARGPGYRYTVRDADVANAVHALYRIVELTSSGRGDATPAFRPARTDESGASRSRGSAALGRKRQR